MKTLALAGALALALALSGCALQTLENGYSVLTGTSVSTNTLYIADNGIVALTASANNYISLPTCPVKSGACKTQAGFLAVDKAVRALNTAMNNISSYEAANPGAVVPVSLYNIATAAVSALNTALTSN